MVVLTSLWPKNFLILLISYPAPTRSVKKECLGVNNTRIIPKSRKISVFLCNRKIFREQKELILAITETVKGIELLLHTFATLKISFFAVHTRKAGPFEALPWKIYKRS